MEPPERDPYQAVWQMSQVGDAGGHSGRRIRWVAGIISGLICLLPFGVLTAAVWGWWQGESDLNAGGFAILLIGLALALCVGGYVATSDD
jgi:hypothetical protein